MLESSASSSSSSALHATVARRNHGTSSSSAAATSISGSTKNGIDKTNGAAAAASSSTTKTQSIPFLVERLPAQPHPRVFDEIASMCIDAFFNNHNSDDNAQQRQKQIMIWKEWQLSYLRNLQRSDLTVRRQRDGHINMMFVARRVVPATRHSARQTPLLLDTSRVQNLPSRSSSHNQVDYVRGEILGFVEVTQRPYGLSTDNHDDDTHENNRRRPVLTNLSVRATARRSGVGSHLVAVCEAAVRREWPLQSEMILEVEDDNVAAQRFYERRGYQVVLEDPASRRYDTSGLFLRQVRCKRIVLRKNLRDDGVAGGSTSVAETALRNVLGTGQGLLQRLRELSGILSLR